MDETRAREPEQWCLGCRRTGERRLGAEERGWIAGLRARHLRRVLLGLALVPAAAALVVGAASILGPARVPGGEFVVDVGLVLTIWVGIPVAFLTVRDHGGAWRRLGRDLEGGEAWWFEAPVAPDAESVAKEAAGFGVLPHSRRFVDVSDRRVPAPRADVIETGPQSAPGWYAPLSLEVRGPGPHPGLRQRTLNAVERSELAQVAAGLCWPGIRFLLAVALLAWGGRYIFLRPPGTPVYVTTIVAIAVWSFVGLRLFQRYLRALRLSLRLRRDLTVGLVVHVPAPVGPGIEFLPISGLPWREAGAPAGWRDRPRAVQRLRLSL